MMDEQTFRSIQGLASCSIQEIGPLLPCCRIVRCTRFQCIQEEGAPTDKVRGVLSGEIVLHRADGARGEPVRLTVIRTGELFGFGEIMLPTYYTEARALTACRLIEIGKEDFIRRFLAVPSIRNYVLLELSRIARYLMHHVTGGDALEDLAAYLFTRSRECGKTIGSSIHLQQKLRQPEIASLLNLSREYVTRLFARLKEEGMVDFNRGYAIINRAWLEQTVRDKDMAAVIQYRDALF